MGGNANRRRRLAAVHEARRAKVASYKVRGLSIRETQAALAADGLVNPTTNRPWSTKVICEDLQGLRMAWREAAKADIADAVALELAKLDETEREARAAWHRSIGTRQEKYAERKTGGKGAGGEKTSIRTEELLGDPRYLEVINGCQERRARLLGLDAAQRVQLSLPDGSAIPVAIEVRFVEAEPAT